MRPGLRTRTTVVAVAVLALAFVAAGVVVVVLLGWSLDKASTENARSAGKQVINEIRKAGARDLTSSDVASTGDTASVIQVLGSTGQPIASDPSISGQAPLTSARPVPGQEAVETATLSINGSSEDYRVVSTGVAGPGGPYTVISARSLDPVDEASTRLSLLLGIAAVPLLTVSALAVYGAVGSALRPVEYMRRTVAEISTRDLNRRVPLPPGNDELHRLATTLNEMLARLSSTHEAQRRFVADASHELRSPLNTLTTALEVSQHHPEAMSTGELVEVVSLETARLRELVDDLLLLARTDDTTDNPVRTEVDLDDLARTEAERARVDLEVEIRATPAKVRGNAPQLRRAIRNLVDNAREHAKSRVRVETRTEGTMAVIEVGDDGPGVPEQDRERIFERFVRRDDARQHRAGGSTGLGLAIVAGIAARHGGSARYVPGHDGACFRLELPLLEDA
ncbi:HAMP domain-containing histidine kinase [Amycolatopsis sp. K13G38]|uniref:histidine kinase n=1 Tax=Amycolatopsis acididurans TaxID=2724524 RepID=A0ABX1JCA4_9PSEU|nr:HAMP domain-containing sensor histidine kinase [Amycolatopsis acididurans]NKQ57393.1 HAMP domain-containing histidine kinase [Amycolatopsis acididurans]